MPGMAKVVRDGNFLAVIAEREFQAIEAMRALAGTARWQESAKLPKASELSTFLMGLPAQVITVLDQQQASAAAKTLDTVTPQKCSNDLVNSGYKSTESAKSHDGPINLRQSR